MQCLRCFYSFSQNQHLTATCVHAADQNTPCYTKRRCIMFTVSCFYLRKYNERYDIKSMDKFVVPPNAIVKNEHFSLRRCKLTTRKSLAIC